MVPENHVAMEEEEDDDIYAPNEAIEFPVQPITASNGASKKGKDLEEGEEEGEEIEEDDSESVYTGSLYGCSIDPNFRV